MSIAELIKIAEKIEDKTLRDKTIQLLKDIRITHSTLSNYPREDPEKLLTPFGINGTFVFRDLINHTKAVTKACISLAEVFEKEYGLTVKKDYLIAGALLHDIMKVYEFKDMKPTGILLDHSSLALAELYKRDFPEEVLHLIISHTAPSINPPKTLEALILHYADTLCALIEFSLQEKTSVDLNELEKNND